MASTKSTTGLIPLGSRMAASVAEPTSRLVDETADFRLVLGSMTFGERMNQWAYQLVNKRTQVIEAQGFSEAQARMALKQSQDMLDAVLSGKVWEEEIPGEHSLDS